MNDFTATAECRVCSERVTLLDAPLHAEDHAQRGEFPPPPPMTQQRPYWVLHGDQR